MTTPFSSYPFDGSGVDNFSHPLFINANRAPTSQDIYPPGTGWLDGSVSPKALYQTSGGGTWENNQLTLSTDATFVGALNTTASSSLAIKTYVDATAIAGAPVATESTQGIGELATDAEAVAGTPSTGVLALFVTPSNLTPVFAAPPAIGGTTPAAGTFTDLTADGTLDLDTTVAGHITVTGAADFTVSSTAGSIVINGEEAVDDAIQLTSAAGGLAVSVALSAVIESTEANADSLQLISAGGADITATGAAGKDIDIVCTSGSINLTAGENIANSMVITNKGMDIAITGAAGQDFDLVNTGGSVNISATENVADAIVINATAGGIDIINTGTAGEDIDIASTGASVNISSTENAALAVYLHANGGTSETIRLRADQGTGANSIEFISDVGGILAQSGLSGANAIYLHADGGTAETIKIHSDQGTGVASVEVTSDVGGVTISSGLASADAINLSASAGGVDVDGALQVNIASSQAAADALRLSASAGGIDVDAVGSAGVDINLTNTGGSVVLVATEAVADAITLTATTALGGIDVNAGTGGMTIDSAGILSIDSAGTTNLTATGAFDVTVNSTAGSVILNAEEAVDNAIQLTSVSGGLDVAVGLSAIITTIETNADSLQLTSAGGVDITATGAAGKDIDIVCTDGSINASSGEADAAAIVVNASAGGLQLLAGGGAGLDTLITNTSGSIAITAGESAADAFALTASGAASGMALSCGTGGFSFDSGMTVNLTSVIGAGGATAVNGDDYVLAVDTSGGTSSLTFPAAPATGRMLIVNDAGGAAAGNNITLNGNGKNIAVSGAIAGSTTISTAYGSVILVYNGTFWNAMRIA